jgi:hypothetical protein
MSPLLAIPRQRANEPTGSDENRHSRQHQVPSAGPMFGSGSLHRAQLRRLADLHRSSARQVAIAASVVWLPRPRRPMSYAAQFVTRWRCFGIWWCCVILNLCNVHGRESPRSRYFRGSRLHAVQQALQRNVRAFG